MKGSVWQTQKLNEVKGNWPIAIGPSGVFFSLLAGNFGGPVDVWRLAMAKLGPSARFVPGVNLNAGGHF